MDKEKNQNPTQGPNKSGPQNKEDKQSVETSSWKRFTSKKWVYPAIYLGSAALILALIVFYQAQSPDKYAIDPEDTLPEVVNNGGTSDDGTIAVNTPEESMTWPVATEAGAKIAMGFYDDQAAIADKEKAVFTFNNAFYPNTGIDLTVDGNTSFDVLAAGSGEVIRAEKDPVVGNLVEIKHSENRITVYHSLENMNVAVGDRVEQGDTIGTAGRNAIRKDLGVHLHFEVQNKDRVAMNPLTYLPQQN